jgi:hypothetical protein
MDSVLDTLTTSVRCTLCTSSGIFESRRDADE